MKSACQNIPVPIIVNHNKGDYIMPYMHYHDSYEIYILKGGNRTYIVDNYTIELKPRDILLIKPNVIHCTTGGNYSSMMVSFKDEYIDRYFSNEAKYQLLDCFQNQVIHMDSMNFDKLTACHNELELNNNNFAAFAMILNLIGKYPNEPYKELNCNSSSTFAAITSYIGDNYKSVYELNEISERFHISKSYLCRIFKKHTGTSVVRYINILKIRCACELLVNSGKSIDEIAKESGFNSSMYFCKTFKNIMSITATEYRKK